MSSTTFAVCGSSSLSHVPDLAVLREPELRRRHGKRLLARGHPGEALALANGVRQVLAEACRQLRLVVEQVHLRRRARLVQIDDALRFGREVGEARLALGGEGSAESPGMPGPRYRCRARRGRRVVAGSCSLACDHLVQIQDHAGGGGVGGEFADVERCVAGCLAGAQQFFRGGAIGAVLCQTLVQSGFAALRSPRQRACGPSPGGTRRRVARPESRRLRAAYARQAGARFRCTFRR